MATIRTSIQITDGMSPAFKSMTTAMNIVLNSFESLQRASHNAIDTNSIQTARTELARAEVSFNQVEQGIRDANLQQQGFNQNIRTGQGAADGLASKIKGFVVALAGAASIKAGVDMTDTYINQNSRLALINDGLQTQAELQQKIFVAAQRSRGEYGETVSVVAKLGLLAKDAFKSNDQTIAFAELMNKSFKISGASTSESSNAMYQLTQAMASGRLQGDEFRSIMENAPMLAQAIATYTGKSMGDLRKMSSDGLISADIIKNSLFNAADDINKKFKTMPMTFGTVWTSIKNTAVMEFSIIMQKINDFLNSTTGTAMVDGITNSISVLIVAITFVLNLIMAVSSFFTDNWSWITPIIWGIVGAFVAYNIVALITNAILGYQALAAGIAAAATSMEAGATFLATVAQYGLNAALMACPIFWIIMAIILVIAVFYAAIAAINKFAGTSISATGVIVGVFMTAAAFIGNVIIAAVNIIIDSFVIMWNFIGSFAEFFANVFNDPIGSIVRLFASMADTVLGILEGIASAIDTLFGSNLASAVSGWRGSLQGAVTNLVGDASIKVEKVDSSALHLERFNYGEAYNSGYSIGKNIEEKFDISKIIGNNKNILPPNNTKPNLAIPDYADIAKAGKDTADNTGAMKDTMEASEEDLKYLRDMAEQEVVNRFTTAEVKVDFTSNNNINSNMDLDGVISYFGAALEETIDSIAEGV